MYSEFVEAADSDAEGELHDGSSDRTRNVQPSCAGCTLASSPTQRRRGNSRTIAGWVARGVRCGIQACAFEASTIEKKLPSTG
jgi:hypothetical protein